MLLSLVSSFTTHLDGVVSINLLIILSCSSFSYGVYFKTGNDTSLLFLFFSTIGLLLYLKFILCILSASRAIIGGSFANTISFFGISDLASVFFLKNLS